MGDAETSKELGEWRTVQRKNLEYTEPAEKKKVASMPQSEQSKTLPEPPMPKGKGTEPSVQIRSRRKNEQVSGRKTLQEDLQSLGFIPSLTKSKMEKRCEDDPLAHKMTGRNESG